LVLATTYAAGLDTGWELSESDVSSTAWWSALFELLYFFGGLSGSWVLARSTARPHVKSAFRRLQSVRIGLKSISRIAEAETPEETARALDKIREVAFVHHQSADDALEDWADLAPQDIAALRGGVSYKDDEHIPIAPGSISRKGGKHE